MGPRQSIQIQTPPYNPKEWLYLTDNNELPQQYGLMRTLQHIKTHEKIDQYEFMWVNEEEYQYYLKSLNWRHKQADVVNTKYFVENNKESICSHNYTARVYIEHPKIRLSEIGDIPFPENLYVLTAAMEGYDKVYEHSKYFIVEQNQICVDEEGHIKIWVNGDLSINYPSNQGLIDYKQKGQADMVDCLVNIIAENTDRQTQPRPSFIQYYEQKRGRGKRFKEAKMVVLSYAKLHKIAIPQRFEAVLNMQSSCQAQNDGDIKSPQNSNNNKKYGNIHIKNMDESAQQSMINKISQANPIPLSPVYKILDFQNRKIQKNGVINRVNSTPAVFPQPYAYQYQPYAYQNQQYANHHPIHVNNVQNNHISYSSNPGIYQTAPCYYPPLQTRIPYQIRTENPLVNQANQSYPLNLSNNKPQIKYNGQIINNLPLNSNRSLPPQIFSAQRDTGRQSTKKNHNSGRNQANIEVNSKRNNFKQEIDRNERINSNAIRQNYANQQQIIYQTAVSSPTSINYLGINDTGMIAKSLPIKTGFPSHSMQQLAHISQNDRPIYSHINPKDSRQTNSKGFPILNHQSVSKQKSILPPISSKSYVNSINQGQLKQVKYFSTLDQQLQIDAQIAADMQKYLL